MFGSFLPHPIHDFPVPTEAAFAAQLAEGGIHTWLDLVRHYYPDLSDAALETILWECTSYPPRPFVGSLFQVVRELDALSQNRMA